VLYQKKRKKTSTISTLGFKNRRSVLARVLPKAPPLDHMKNVCNAFRNHNGSNRNVRSRSKVQNRVSICRRKFGTDVRYIPGSSTSYGWPKEYQEIYKPFSEKWPETTPLNVVNFEGSKISLSHVKGSVSKPLIHHTMISSLESTVSQYGDRKAISVPFQNISWTYAELLKRVDSLALGLLRLGVSKGDRIGVWLPNTNEWLTLQYATARIGAILVCVNPAYRANELAHSVNLIGLKGIFFQASIKTSNYIDLLKLAAPGIEKQKVNKIHVETMPSLRFLVHISSFSELVPDSFPSTLYDDILVTSTRESLQAFEKLPKMVNTEPTNIQFTSGTTGLPKGTTLTHLNIVNNGYFVGERLGMTPDDIVVTPVPMYHCFGCVMSNIASVTHGSHLIYPAPQFNPSATLKAVNDFKATMLHGVPTMFITERALPNFSDYDLSTLRSGIMAGSSCPEVTMNMVRNEMHLKDITICYGMTETSPVSIQTATDDPIWARVETVGRIHDHLEVKLINGEGQTVPTGQTGEILTKGYSIMQGYWGNDVATEKSVIDGWMHTGDLGTMDEQGYVRVIGRNKDMISRGGEKVYPREVEEFLYQHPSIQDVQIVGVPDSRLGEELFAWIKLKSGHSPLTVSDIAEFCRNKISHYKIPRYVECIAPEDDFPMTVSGKIQKFILRERSIKSLGLDKSL
jgi:fatty-acyl-CoA synthase